MIGVMALIAILAAVVVPPLISTIETADTSKEDANLEEIARALLVGIKAEGRIPNPDVNPFASQGWAAMASKYSILGSNALLRSVPRSSRDTVRRYFLSPQLTNFLKSAYSAGSTWSTNDFPSGAFMMLVSVSKDDLQFASTCRTNANLASNDVIWLQNWAKIYNTAGRVEATNLNIVGTIFGATNRWTNRGQFLHVKVVDLRNLLCSVQLVDAASPVTVSDSSSVPGSASAPPAGTVISSNGYTVDLSFWPTVRLADQPSMANFMLFNSGSGSSKKEYNLSFVHSTGGGTTNYNVTLKLADSPYYGMSSNSASSIQISDYSPSLASGRRNSTNFVVLYGTPIYLFDSTRTLQGDPFVAKKENHFLVYKGAWSEE
jgi:type II secretory pathway pseudopilin PulG